MTNARDLPDLVYAAGGHFPHHTEGVARGHSNASVNRAELLTALILVESAEIDISPQQRMRAKAHLAAHARGLGVSVVTEADNESVRDRSSRIVHDFHEQVGSMFAFDSPWIVDIFDTYVVARANDGRYKRYDMTESDNVFTFADPITVRKEYVVVGSETGESLDEGLESIPMGDKVDGADPSSENKYGPGINVIQQINLTKDPAGVAESIKALQEHSAQLTPTQVRLIHAHTHELQERYESTLVALHNAVESVMIEHEITHETIDSVLDEKVYDGKNKKKKAKTDESSDTEDPVIADEVE